MRAFHNLKEFNIELATLNNPKLINSVLMNLAKEEELTVLSNFIS
jgi:hypothetical protein